MEEKNKIRISLSTVFLILAIIVIIIMGMYIYKLKNDKVIEIEKSTNFQTQINSLNRTINDLNGKINSISDTLNSNTSTDINNKPDNLNSNETTNTNSVISNDSNNTVKNKIIGSWQASNVLDSDGNDPGLRTVYGSGIYTANRMEFYQNGKFSFRIGITASDDDGSYTINGNTISCNIPSDMDGIFNSKIFTYIPEEDILKEEFKSYSGEKLTITYIRRVD